MAKTIKHNPGTADWGPDGNWLTITGGASTKPASTDTVYFSAGQDNITGTLNQSAVDLTALYETDGSTNRLGGGSGGSLLIDVNQTNTGIIDKGGAGIWQLSGIYYKVIVRSGYLGITGGTTGGTGTFAGSGSLNVIAGECYVFAATVLASNSIIQHGGLLTVEYLASDVPANLTVYDGRAIIYRPLAVLVVNGGNVIYQVENVATASPAITVNGGLLDWRAGWAASLAANGGNITFENQVLPITITNATFAGSSVTNRLGTGPLLVTYGSATIVIPPDKS